MTGGNVRYQRNYFYAMAKSKGKEDVYCPCQKFHSSPGSTWRCWNKLKKVHLGYDTVEVRSRSSLRPMDDHRLDGVTKEFEERYVRGDLRKKVKPEQRPKRYTNLKHTGGEE